MFNDLRWQYVQQVEVRGECFIFFADIGGIVWSSLFVGFDPRIPGYDRYSVISNSVDEFNLNIVNTQLSDDGTFECQVMPTDGNPPLRTTAVLTILGKL
jgi:hypothetical protein